MSILRSLSVFSLALLCLVSRSTAQRTRLNVPLSRDVRHFVVSPDGTRMVYSAKRSPEAFVALFSVGIVDGASKLLDPGRIAQPIEFGAGGRVVYVRSGPFEVCSVPSDGSAAPIVLGAAGSFRLGSGGHQAVFEDAAGMWVVPIDGSAAPALIEAQPTPFQFHTFNVTPDGTHVLYGYEDFGPSGQGPLHAARLDRSTPPVVLNDATSECTLGSSSFLGSPDGKWVVFRSGGLLSFNRRLFIVPIDDSAPPAQLHPTRPAGGFEAFNFANQPVFSPDGKRIVYQVDQDVPNQEQLFSALVDGSAPPVELSAPLPSGGQVFMHRLSHDGEQVVYLATQDDAQVIELYVVPILGGTPRKLSPPGDPIVGNFVLSPDGRNVAYVSDPAGPATMQLFLASLVPGPPVIPLSAPASPVGTFLFDSEGAQLAYVSLHDGSHPYAVKASGAPLPVRLDAPSLAGSSVNGPMRFAAGDSQLVYIADLERDDVFELWASPLEKRGPPARR